MPIDEWNAEVIVKKVGRKAEGRLDKAAVMVQNEVKRLMRLPKTGVVMWKAPKGSKGSETVLVRGGLQKSAAVFGKPGKRRKTRARKIEFRSIIRRSAPGEAPAVETGKLINSVKWVVSGQLERKVGYLANVDGKGDYGAALELGAPNRKTGSLLPRPALVPALFNKSKDIKKLFEKR